jgi:hypothetical protein
MRRAYQRSQRYRKAERRRYWEKERPRRVAYCRAYSRGWRSTENGANFQEFNKQYEADRKAKRAAAKEAKGKKQPRKKT